MITQELYQSYLQHLIKGKRKDCSQVVKYLLEQSIDIKTLYTHLLQKALYEVGEMWEQNRISVATEHIATSTTESVLNTVYPYLFAQEHTEKKIILSCVAKEFHQIGAKMVADIFEMNGWNTFFVGANTPDSDLIDLINQEQPDMLGLSVSLFFNVNSLKKILLEVRNHFDKIPIIVGGQAFLWGGQEVLDEFENLSYIADLSSLETFIQSEKDF